MITHRSRRQWRHVEDFPELVPLELEDFSPPWELEPQAPFVTQAWHETNHVGPVKLNTSSFDDAMNAACQTLGPGVGAAMVVLDEGFHVVFGYTARSTVIVEFGAPVWYGCRVAYEWLERSGRFDLMDLAVWESTAKDRAL